MTLTDKIKVVDELIKENEYATIRDFINEVQSIDEEVKDIKTKNPTKNSRVTSVYS